MKPVVVSQTGVGNSPWVPLDQYQNPCNVSVKVAINGTVTFTVVETYDNPFTVANPNADAVLIASGSVAANGSISGAPVAALQLQVTAGTGTATMTVNQAGAVGG